MEKILTAHQPVYLPWLGLFNKIALADEFCYFDDAQYQTRDWNNRNQIKGPNGTFWLSVPVKSKDHFSKKVSEVEIDNNQNWMKKHLKALKFNYNKAEYFKDYYGFFEECYSKEWALLSDLNEHMLKWFLDALGIKVDYCKMSEKKFEGEKSDLVLDMCKKLGADIYIFGELGKGYAKEEDFKSAGIDIYFQEYEHPTYTQLYGEFLPNLSVVDLLFNCGTDSKSILMDGNITEEELRAMFKNTG